jgi:hypothetical protein
MNLVFGSEVALLGFGNICFEFSLECVLLRSSISNPNITKYSVPRWFFPRCAPVRCTRVVVCLQFYTCFYGPFVHFFYIV